MTILDMQTNSNVFDITISISSVDGYSIDIEQRKKEIHKSLIDFLMAQTKSSELLDGLNVVSVSLPLSTSKTHPISVPSNFSFKYMIIKKGHFISPCDNVLPKVFNTQEHANSLFSKIRHRPEYADWAITNVIQNNDNITVFDTGQTLNLKLLPAFDLP